MNTEYKTPMGMMWVGYWKSKHANPIWSWIEGNMGLMLFRYDSDHIDLVVASYDSHYIHEVSVRLPRYQAAPLIKGMIEAMKLNVRTREEVVVHVEID